MPSVYYLNVKFMFFSIFGSDSVTVVRIAVLASIVGRNKRKFS